MESRTIIVMSDSHGDREIVSNIKQRYQGEVDAIFHNGDSELPSSDPIWDGIKVVRGNCDYDTGYPERLTTYLDDIVIAQTHGHLYNINFTWDRLDLFAQEEDADICLGTCIVQLLGVMVILFLSIQVVFFNLVVTLKKSFMRK